MKRLLLCGLVVVSSAISVKADSLQIANELGNLLASEKYCDLTYDQAAISTYIEEKVAADDLAFAGNLQLMTSGSEFQIKELSNSAKTAHCTQVRRSAKAHGFIE